VRGSYAVNWQEQEGAISSGKLELRRCSILFEGQNGAGHHVIEIPYREISALRIARRASDKIGGRPTLVVERGEAPAIRIASVAQPGIVSELAEHLAGLNLGEEDAVSRVLVVIPLRAGARDRAKALIREGPPFDPDAAGLERNHVFLTESEVVFVLVATTPDSIEGLVRRANVWTAASDWAELAAGPPRIAEGVFDWVRPEVPENVLYSATPGPGDSEGGDLYAP
jgi:hypothetical protein